MAPERGICSVLATSQAVILCAMIHEDTREGYNYALNLVKWRFAFIYMILGDSVLVCCLFCVL